MIFLVFIELNLKFVAGDRNQLFLEVEDVEAGDLQGVAEVEFFVAGDLQEGVAEDPRGVGVVASGAEGDFRVTLPSPFHVVAISGCFRIHKSHSFMLVLVVTCGFVDVHVYVYVYLAEEFVLDEVNYRCLF